MERKEDRNSGLPALGIATFVILSIVAGLFLYFAPVMICPYSHMTLMPGTTMYCDACHRDDHHSSVSVVRYFTARH